MKNNLFAAIFILLSFSSCKREKTNWSTDWNVPLVHGQLTLDDLISPNYTTTNSEGYLSIVYQEPLFSFSLDTLIDLPDTSIVKKTTVNFPSLTINPGFSYSDFFNQEYILDQIELKRVIVKSGQVEMTIRSPWPGKSSLTFDFPKILDQGTPFNRIFFLEAGSITNPSVATETIDISGFDMDLTGLSGTLFNNLSGDIVVGSNETVTSYNVTNSDSIEYEIKFANLVPRYAKGYFGSYQITDTSAFALPFMNSVIGGSIDIDSIDLNISIRNGFNLLATSKVTLLSALNSKTGTTVDLNFQELGTNININPASGNMYGYTPSEYPIEVSNQNSNITAFIENLPDSILLGYELIINPYGNTTAGSDELFPDSKMELFLDGEFPLEFGANDLGLTDTFSIDYNASQTYTGNEAVVKLSYNNGFPISAAASLFLLDESGVVIDSIISSSQINSGSFNAQTFVTTPTSGEVSFNLSASNIANLDLSKNLILHVYFNSDSNQKVKIDANAFFDFSLRSNLQIELHI
jgi:hypothetical protein